MKISENRCQKIKIYPCKSARTGWHRQAPLGGVFLSTCDFQLSTSYTPSTLSTTSTPSVIPVKTGIHLKPFARPHRFSSEFWLLNPEFLLIYSSTHIPIYPYTHIPIYPYTHSPIPSYSIVIPTPMPPFSTPTNQTPISLLLFLTRDSRLSTLDFQLSTFNITNGPPISTKSLIFNVI